jgi:catechol 2,3-dioxygenase-like lactoylglutathione lyase family enzyme
MQLHFDAIYYHVSDLDRAIGLYRDLPGLQLVRRDVVACLEIEGVTVELVPDESVGQSGGGNARLCFRVKDIRAACAELLKKDVRVGPVPFSVLFAFLGGSGVWGVGVAAPVGVSADFSRCHVRYPFLQCDV